METIIDFTKGYSALPIALFLVAIAWRSGRPEEKRKKNGSDR